MADFNERQVIVVDDQTPMEMPEQHQNHVAPPYVHPPFMTADEQQTRAVWDDINSPRRGSNSFTAISIAGAVQYDRLLDASRQLRNDNRGLAGENNNLKIQSMNLRAEARTRIANLEGDL